MQNLSILVVLRHELKGSSSGLSLNEKAHESFGPWSLEENILDEGLTDYPLISKMIGKWVGGKLHSLKYVGA